MTLYIGPEDQKTVDGLLIALAQVTVDMTEVFTHDPNSQRKKTAVLMQLADVRQRLDALGLLHSMAGKVDDARPRQTEIQFFGTRV